SLLSVVLATPPRSTPLPYTTLFRSIVYCLTVAMAEQVAAHLRADGLEVRAYSGQTDPAEREAAEEDLLANRVKALVATSALGMRSEEHTSELQSREKLVCRLLLETK